MESFFFSEEWLLKAILIWVRTSTIFLIAPFFGQAMVPIRVRILLSLGISLSLAHVIAVQVPASLGSVTALSVALVMQVMVGLILGFAALIVFSGIQVAGSVVATQAGFSLINIIDPQTSVENSIISVFLNSLALTLFLAWNGHHLILRALAKSFSIQDWPFQAPAHDLWLSLAHLTGQVFLIGVQVAAPLYGLMVITDLLISMAGKIAPQIPILIIGFPLKLLMGIMGLSLCLYLLPALLERFFLDSMAWFGGWMFAR